MRIYLIAAAAAATLSAPALAGADGGYVGIEGGAMFAQHNKYDVTLDGDTRFDNGLRVKHKTGYDIDLIAGYKRGLLRLEGEGSYKRASLKDVQVDPALVTAVSGIDGGPVTGKDFKLDGHFSITSIMVNALADTNFGSSRFGGYVGGGVGSAWGNLSGENDNALAVQGIVGLRASLTDHLDAGLKYRYFHTGNMSFDRDVTINHMGFSTHTTGNYNSSSVLASLVYNFASPEPRVAEAAVVTVADVPPPPPTQTCPDGSVVDANAACAAPPPPPPPATQSGERG
jgi:OOP family OmpA-OmpF porin